MADTNTRQSVLNYVLARQAADAAQAALDDAKIAVNIANDMAKAAWELCKGAKPGVYAFDKETKASVAVIVHPFMVDNPELLSVIAPEVAEVR